MNRLLLLLAIVLAASCATQTEDTWEKVNEASTRFLNEELRRNDSTITLDSIRLVRIDTLTDHSKWNARTDRLLSQVDSLQRQHHLMLLKLKTHVPMLELAGLSRDRDMFRRTMEDFAEDTAKAGAITRQIENIDALASSYSDSASRADSVTFRHFFAVGFFQSSRGARLLARDSFRLIITNDFKVIPYKDYWQ